MIPILTNVAVALPGIFVGSFLIEVFFSIPGLGREILLAVNRSDYPVIQAFAIYIAVDHDGRQPAHRRALQAGRPAGGAVMSAVHRGADPGARRATAHARPGVWTAAARRFRSDRVGMVSLVDRRAVPAPRRRCRRVGLVAATGKSSAAFPTRRRPSSGPAAPDRERRRRRRRAGPNVDISAIDPLAPRYKEWDEAAEEVPDARERARPTTLPFGGDRLGRDVLAKAIKGAQISILVGVSRGAAGDDDRHAARRGRRLLRRQGRRPARVGLQRLHRDPEHPADLRVRGGVRPRRRLGRADPRPRRLDRHLPPGARRVHEARGARLRALGRGDRRRQRLAHVPPHPAQRQPRDPGAAVDPTSSASSSPR